MIDQTATLDTALKRATDDINKANPTHEADVFAAYAPRASDGPVVGKECAEKIRTACERTARAIEEQAEERLQVALSAVEDAKIHQDKAKAIANEVRAGGELEAQRAIDLAQKLHESTELMDTLASKFAAAPLAEAAE